MKTLKFGVLAEDRTDCDAIDVLVRRIASIDEKKFRLGIAKYSGKGCARLRKAAGPKMKLMADDGCTAAIVVHDLDRNPDNGELNDELALRAQLEGVRLPDGLSRLICIPVEELEAWFWSDPVVVKEVGRGRGKDHPSPHLIRSPKEALIRLSVEAKGKPRYSTNDNPSLAAKLNLDLCAQRCRAFYELRNFVRETAEIAAR